MADVTPRWNDPELDVASDSARVRRYRRHQSRHREQVLDTPPGIRHGGTAPVGNMLDAEAVERNRALNFVDDRALAAADRRAIEVQREGGTLEVGRLFHNMMSSMTMCFNMFGSLGATSSFVTIMRSCFDPDADSIDDVTCELTPTRSLNDRTAFDAHVAYRTATGDERFLAIETKYTEPFSQVGYNNDRYREVTESSSWFISGAADALAARATNQLWRGLMLTSLVEDETGARGTYVVVTPRDDSAAVRAVDATRQWMAEPHRLLLVPMEGIVEQAAASGDPTLVEWSERFGRRYIVE